MLPHAGRLDYCAFSFLLRTPPRGQVRAAMRATLRSLEAVTDQAAARMRRRG